MLIQMIVVEMSLKYASEVWIIEIPRYFTRFHWPFQMMSPARERYQNGNRLGTKQIYPLIITVRADVLAVISQALRLVLTQWRSTSSYGITLTSQWAWLRLKSPASRLFTQPFVQTQIKKIPATRHWGFCEWNSPLTSEFSTQRASDAENVSIWWRHHGPAFEELRV